MANGHREPTDPWFYADKAVRNYLTPEDVTDAIEAGATKEILYRCVLDALGRRRCEDWSLCAFVAVHSNAWALQPESDE